MNIEQQNRNVTEVFEWNDASLLTGDIRLGAEMCSDRKVVTQVKTQIEIDREVFNAYDKLYPGEFMISVEPSVINDIVPTNTNVVTEACDKSIVIIRFIRIHYSHTINYKNTQNRYELVSIHQWFPNCELQCPRDTVNLFQGYHEPYENKNKY